MAGVQKLGGDGAERPGSMYYTIRQRPGKMVTIKNEGNGSSQRAFGSFLFFFLLLWLIIFLLLFFFSISRVYSYLFFSSFLFVSSSTIPIFLFFRSCCFFFSLFLLRGKTDPS